MAGKDLEMNSTLKNTDNEVVLRVLSEVFEGFAFMFVEEEPDFDSGAPVECLSASIRFSGKSAAGVFEIVSPVDFCEELAENILGAETDELPPDAGEGALKEVVNVACGYLLSEKFGTEEVFDLSIPVTASVNPNEWCTFFEGGSYALYLVEESPILVRLESAPAS